jgi:hypothetical protein
MTESESQLLFYKILFSYFQRIHLENPNFIFFMQAKLIGLFRIYLGNHDLFLKTCVLLGLNIVLNARRI